MEISVNGQRYRSWNQIPVEVRRDLVESGVFQDGDGTGVPDEMLPRAGTRPGSVSRYALTINGVSYGPGKPVPALLASVVHSLGDHREPRTPFPRPRQRTARVAPSARTGADRRPGLSAVSNRIRSTGRRASEPTGQLHRKATAGPTTAQPGSATAQPGSSTVQPSSATAEPGSSTVQPASDPGVARWDRPAVTSWEGPASSEPAGPGTAKAAKPPAYSTWVGAGRQIQAPSGTRHPDVIVETRSMSRAAVLAGLFALTVLVVVLLVVTGT